MHSIRLGAGAGYSGDRIEPAIELAEKGEIDYLVFECLAERTIALAQQARMKDPRAGYDPLLAARMRAVLPICRAKGIKLITNMGGANPVAAAEATRDIAHALGVSGIRIAAITGDDVLAAVKQRDLRTRTPAKLFGVSATQSCRQMPISAQSRSPTRSPQAPTS
jgi:hypothetical protein